MKVKVTKKVNITFLVITFVLFVVQTSNLSHIVAFGKANKFVASKVKGHSHMKGQNNNFSHNFCSICGIDFNLASYCRLWKGQ